MNIGYSGGSRGSKIKILFARTAGKIKPLALRKIRRGANTTAGVAFPLCDWETVRGAGKKVAVGPWWLCRGVGTGNCHSGTGSTASLKKVAAEETAPVTAATMLGRRVAMPWFRYSRAMPYPDIGWFICGVAVGLDAGSGRLICLGAGRGAGGGTWL